MRMRLYLFFVVCVNVFFFWPLWLVVMFLIVVIRNYRGCNGINSFLQCRFDLPSWPSWLMWTTFIESCLVSVVVVYAFVLFAFRKKYWH